MKEVKKDIYHLLHPKMAGFITSAARSSKPKTGNAKRNIMACAWTTPVSEEPQIVLIALWEKGYTQKLIMESKEFVINIPNRKLAKKILEAGSVSGRKADKFEKFGVETAKAKKVKAPGVKGCIGYLECRLWKTIKAGECFVFFGNVLAAYADEKYFKKGEWTENAEIPLHLGGRKMVYANLKEK